MLLTGIDERYGRWTPRPGEQDSRKAADRRKWDRQNSRPTFYCVRYADDFVILVEGSLEDAETEKRRLGQFLQEEMHLELSPEKTLVTPAEDGFEFLGFRALKSPSLRTGQPVGKLHIPKGKLQLLRDRLKAMTSRSTTGQSLEALLHRINPIITGWSNYYRQATGAWKEFNALDHWMWFRVYRWLRKKHPKSTSHALRRRYRRRDRRGGRSWGEGKAVLNRFACGPVAEYRRRGVRISNGWNDKMDGVYFYSEVTRPISGYTWLGTLLGEQP